MSEFMARWFSDTGFVSRGDAYQWDLGLLWTYVVSDAVMGIAFYTLPVTLFYFARKRADVRLFRILVLFSMFAVACGTTHFLSIWMVWQPDYWLDAMLNAGNALIAIVTSVLLWRLVPQALEIPGRMQLQQAIRRLEHEIAERKHAEEALLESQALLRKLAAYQEQIREDERKRIAREIHDELGQNLLALRLDVSMLHARTSARHPQLRKRVGAALEYIDTTMKSLRAIMNNLRPAVLDLGLHAAIEWQVRQFERRSSIQCELVMADDGMTVGDAHATAIFRILQESLTNVGRHARATYVRIEMRVDEQRLVLVVKDNGIGMYPSDRRKLQRFGLVGIEERVTMLGGELKIDSLPGQGTTLSLSIPLGLTTPSALAAATESVA